MAYWTGRPLDRLGERLASIVSALECDRILSAGHFNDRTWSAFQSGERVIDARPNYYENYFEIRSSPGATPAEIVQRLASEVEAGRTLSLNVTTPYVRRLAEVGTTSQCSALPYICHGCRILGGGADIFDASEGDYFCRASVAVVFPGRGAAPDDKTVARNHILQWPVTGKLKEIIDHCIGPSRVSIWWESAAPGAPIAIEAFERTLQWPIFDTDDPEAEMIIIPTVFPPSCNASCDRMLADYKQLESSQPAKQTAAAADFSKSVTAFLICTGQVIEDDRTDVEQIILQRVKRNLAKLD